MYLQKADIVFEKSEACKAAADLLKKNGYHFYEYPNRLDFRADHSARAAYSFLLTVLK